MSKPGWVIVLRVPDDPDPGWFYDCVDRWLGHAALDQTGSLHTKVHELRASARLLDLAAARKRITGVAGEAPWHEGFNSALREIWGGG